MRRFSLFLGAFCLAIWFAGCSSDNNGGNNPPPPSSQPSVSSITPSSVSRGQSRVEGKILGTNLGGVVSVSLGDGITIQEFSSVSPNEITIRFSVAVNAAAGARTITVTTSAGTATASAALTIDSNRAPTPKFTISPNSGAKNTVFTFDASNSSDPEGVIATYKWDFGDGSSEVGRVVSHRFKKGGMFEVILTITDRDNTSNSLSRSIEVEDGLAPVAKYTISPSTGDVDTTFMLDASGSTDKDGRIVRFEWIFGDGGRASGMTVTHKFVRDGSFQVKLMVTDDDGFEADTVKELLVGKFDDQGARDEMTKVVTRFFNRFSNLETLDAETIVEDWSLSPDCPGRAREIRIIEEQKLLISKTEATIVGEMEIYIKPNHVAANVNVVAEFKWTEKDGDTGQGQATHDFDFRVEEGSWLICNFKLIQGEELAIFPKRLLE